MQRHRVTRRGFLKLSGVAALAAGGWRAGPASAQAEEIKIGALYPLTGSLARVGANMKKAVDLAVEIINAPHPELAPLTLAASSGLPRLGGRRIRLVWADAKDPATARAEAERLIDEEKVVALMGCYASAFTATASLAAETRGVPFVNPESSSPTLTKRDFKWFFRTGPHDGIFTAMFYKMFADLKTQGRRIGKIAILSENTEFGASATRVEEEMGKSEGYQLVAREMYTSPPASLDAELTRIRASAPDALIANGYLIDAVTTIRTLKTMGYFPPALVAQDSGYVLPDYVKDTGKDGDYIISRASWALGLGVRKPLVRKVNDVYRSRYNEDMDETNARSFTGLLALADAINRGGGTGPTLILQGLLTTNIPGGETIMPWQGIKFDKDGQNMYAIGVMVQLLGGQYKVVWPFDLAETAVVWPAPAWANR
ncbi:MAG TPA: ABC transporter substrate-binding protein [bacterium]|nr:ABC transporter substrate-binding protein [bacterium]